MLHLPHVSLLMALRSFEVRGATPHLHDLEFLPTSFPATEEMDYWKELALTLVLTVDKLPNLEQLRISPNCVPSESARSWFHKRVKTLYLGQGEEDTAVFYETD